MYGGCWGAVVGTIVCGPDPTAMLSFDCRFIYLSCLDCLLTSKGHSGQCLSTLKVGDG